MDVRSASLLSGRKGLVVGTANEHSIAYGCARMFRNCGAELAMTWINEKTRTYVEPLARELSATIMMPLEIDTEANGAHAFTISRAQAASWWLSSRPTRNGSPPLTPFQCFAAMLQ